MAEHNIRTVLEDTRKLLQFYQAMGIDAYPSTDTVKAFLTEKKPPCSAPPSTPGRIPPEKNKPIFRDIAGGATLTDIQNELGDCTRCTLCTNRSNIVFGHGNHKAELMLIEDWPSPDDDRNAIPFSGEAGELLDKMIGAIGLKRDDIYTASLLKCMVKSNQKPTPDNIKACLPFLLRQIELIAPRILCVMGQTAAQSLLSTDTYFFRLRGKFHSLYSLGNNQAGKGIRLIASFHPAFLIKNPEMKKASWQDLKQIKKQLSVDSSQKSEKD
jgi:DNA polymerase